MTIITPSQWASGAVEALPDSDMRRAFPNAVSIAAGPSLQADIDALPVHVQTLTIRSGIGLYDDAMQGVTLEKYSPELQELQLIDVSLLAQDETVDGEREGRVPIEKSADRMSFTNSWNSRATTNMFT